MRKPTALKKPILIASAKTAYTNREQSLEPPVGTMGCSFTDISSPEQRPG
jgi:hypothetical protein